MSPMDKETDTRDRVIAVQVEIAAVKENLASMGKKLDQLVALRNRGQGWSDAAKVSGGILGGTLAAKAMAIWGYLR